MSKKIKISSLAEWHSVWRNPSQIEKIPLPIPEAGILPGEVKEFRLKTEDGSPAGVLGTAYCQPGAEGGLEVK